MSSDGSDGRRDIFISVQVSRPFPTDTTDFDSATAASAPPDPIALGRAADEIAATFRLLGDPTRIRILAALEHHAELCVHEIAEIVAVSETNVSQALRLLRVAGIVRNRRVGRHVHYRLDDDHVRTLLAVTGEHTACGR